ncbi:MAG TPA: hypothetical protein VMS41_05385 [Gaiellaceae bacterium]|nr:hypothetical protein [Gaiellaceae bacterium]
MVGLIVAFAVIGGGKRSQTSTPRTTPSTYKPPPRGPRHPRWIVVKPDGSTQGPYDSKHTADNLAAQINATIDRGQYVPAAGTRAFVQMV